MNATTPAVSTIPGPAFARLAALLPRLVSPTVPLLQGRTGRLQVLPDNVICFRRTEAAMLNGEHRGRFLHHRFTLMLALQTPATVCVDHSAYRLEDGMGLLVFPFQFHHYIRPGAEEIRWLFVTFELAETDRMKPLLNQPFAISPAVRQHAADLIRAFLDPGRADLTKLHLAILLEHMLESAAKHRRPFVAERSAREAWVTRINLLAERKMEPVKAKELASQLGVSVSHLRAQFQQSSGVSLGRHLRMLRLERACGLLRLSSARITEVAEESGFSSIYVFSRTFRHAYGISPLAYRRRFLGAGAGAVIAPVASAAQPA